MSQVSLHFVSELQKVESFAIFLGFCKEIIDHVCPFYKG